MLRPRLFLSLFILFSLLAFPLPQPGKAAPALPESPHPYSDNVHLGYTVSNSSGSPSFRIHFSRLETEPGVDVVEIRDGQDVLIQTFSGSYPDGVWSDPIPGNAALLQLVSDGSCQYWDQFWGFQVDQVQPLTYAPILFSPHPYPANLSQEKTLSNTSSLQTATRIHFDRVDLEAGVDYLLIQDLSGSTYQRITGSYPTGWTTPAVAGNAVKLVLITDESGTDWGYSVDQIEGMAVADSPITDPLYPQNLAESPHPYTEGVTLWQIINPDANATATKVHFQKYALDGSDTIQLLDESGLVYQTLEGASGALWSAPIPGRTVTLRLSSRSRYWNDWGFLVDGLASLPGTPAVAETQHPYPAETDLLIKVTNPNPNALSTKVHFERLTRYRADSVDLLDEQGTLIQTLKQDVTDFWSDYVPGRVVQIRFRSSNSFYQDWGFRIDRLTDGTDHPGLAQSHHPYPSGTNQVWTITNPDPNAPYSQVHLSALDLYSQDALEVLDGSGSVVQKIKGTKANFWTVPVRGTVIQLRLVSKNQFYQGWGFRADAIRSMEQVFLPQVQK